MGRCGGNHFARKTQEGSNRHHMATSSAATAGYTWGHWLALLGLPALAVLAASYLAWRRRLNRIRSLSLVISWYGHLPDDLLVPAYDILCRTDLLPVIGDNGVIKEYRLAVAYKMLTAIPDATYHNGNHPGVLMEFTQQADQMLAETPSDRLVTRLAVYWMATRQPRFLDKLFELCEPSGSPRISEYAAHILRLFRDRGMVGAAGNSGQPLPLATLAEIRRICSK
jgi:hypothetical protein